MYRSSIPQHSTHLDLDIIYIYIRCDVAGGSLTKIRTEQNAKFWLSEKHQRNVDILFYSHSQCLEAWLDANNLKVPFLCSLHQIAWLKMYFVENMLNVDSELKYDFRSTTLGSDQMGGDWGRDISCQSHEDQQQQNTWREGYRVHCHFSGYEQTSGCE